MTAPESDKLTDALDLIESAMSGINGNTHTETWFLATCARNALLLAIGKEAGRRPTDFLLSDMHAERRQCDKTDHGDTGSTRTPPDDTGN